MRLQHNCALACSRQRDALLDITLRVVKHAHCRHPPHTYGPSSGVSAELGRYFDGGQADPGICSESLTSRSVFVPTRIY